MEETHILKLLKSSSAKLHYETEFDGSLVDAVTITLAMEKPDGTDVFTAQDIIGTKVSGTTGEYEPGLTTTHTATEGRNQLIWLWTYHDGVETHTIRDVEYVDIYPLELIYASLDDLKKYGSKMTFSSTTKPTELQAVGIIISVANELNLLMNAAAYSLPITDIDLLDYLNDLNCYGAMAKICRSMFPTAPEMSKEWANDFKEGKKALRSGELVASTATRTGGGLPGSYQTENPGDDHIDPEFTKDMEF